MNTKRIVIIIAAAALVVLALVLARVFFGEEAVTQTPQAGTLPQSAARQAQAEPNVVGRDKETPVNAQAQQQAELLQLSDSAIAGAGIVDENARFVSAATGHVFSARLSDGAQIQLSNTTIPRMREVMWNASGERMLLRLLNDEGTTIRNFLARISASSTVGAFVSPDIIAVSPSPDRAQFAMLVRAGSAFALITSEFENNAQKEVRVLPFGEFRLSWPATNTITLQTASSRFTNGVFYALDVGSGALTKLLAGVPALSASLSSDARRALYSTATDAKDIALFLFDTKERAGEELSLATLPEKCVWSRLVPSRAYCAVPSFIPNGDYPDDWYKGRTSFADFFVVLDARSKTLRTVFGQTPLDATELLLDSKEQYLLFTNKKDGALWRIRLP